MKDIQFNSVNTRIRTYEQQLLSKAMYERLLMASSADELYGILQETTYSKFLDEELTVHNFEKMLLAELSEMYRNLYAISPSRLVIDLFTLKYDYQNLKVLVKADYNQEDLSSLLVPYGSIPLATLKELVRAHHSPQVADAMNECVAEVYGYLEEYHERHSLDIIFDNYYWKHLTQLVEGKENEEFQRLVRRNIDVFNISATLRSHLMGRHRGFIQAVLADGGTLATEELLEAISQSLDEFVVYLQASPYRPLIEVSHEEMRTAKTLNDFDLQKDNFLMERLKEQKMVPFGPLAIMGYIYAKEIEIKNLRILFIGKINKIPEETLRRRVRESYV